ncbi:aspartate/glutamate racemase family protein [Streptomyces sp. NPDC020875]|uniref:aspartate/glutamate racemase family protein n=1 Tax=Streptomyces sp. NPDC020875 TaxID=3154898 RepID=UPI0033CDB749
MVSGEGPAGSAGPVLALLHTSAVHPPVFDALRDRHHPGVGLRHLVHEGLLARAVAEGPEAVADEVSGVVGRAVAAGAGAVLCTCSTIGAVAEASAGRHGVPVLRVDRPMAAEAAARGRAVVLAALASTLGPTEALIRAEAAGRPLELRSVLVPGAWERFEAGDAEGYARTVAAAVDAVRDTAVIVLAQASMAPATGYARTAIPVLAGPESGLRAAVTALNGG